GPAIGTPGNFTVARISSSGGSVVVNYTASATDACYGTAPVVCTPASGSLFPAGATLVTCVADDAHGHTNSASFTITVGDALTPHLDSVAGAVTNVLGSTVFINHGLVGVGHIS